jgi:hypothetical protein
MSYMTSLAEALGKGIVSTFESIDDGFQQTKIDLFFDGKEEAIASYKDKYKLVEETYLIIKNHNDQLSPAYVIISTVLEHYYEAIPPELLNFLAKKTGLYSAYYVGRKAIGQELAYFIAKMMVIKFNQTLTIAGIFKTPASAEKTLIKLGDYAIGGLMLNSIFANSRNSAIYLRINFPNIYRELAQRKLEMLFFLVRKPLQKYLDTILIAQRYSRKEFTRMIYKKWNLPCNGC